MASAAGAPELPLGGQRPWRMTGKLGVVTMDWESFRTSRESRDALYGFARRKRGGAGDGTYELVSRLGYPTWLSRELEPFFSWPSGPAPRQINSILAWLEEDHFALHTGYLKQKILRRLRRFIFDSEQETVLRRVVLASIQRGRRQEFVETRRLARQLDGPAFRQDLETLTQAVDADTAERARLILGLCQRRPL